jgi:drug/metabolite transporter (DMT)-like permease
MEAKFLTSEWYGLASSLGAAVVWSLSTSIYRKYGVGKSPIWLNLFKCIVALMCFSVILIIDSGGGGQADLRVHMVLAASGVVGVLLGDSAFFAALPYIGATMTSAIQCLAPPLTGVLAWMFLGESLGLTRVAGLMVTSTCLAGLIWFESRDGTRANPDFNGVGFRQGLKFSILAAVCQATGAVIARPVLDGVSPFVSSAGRLWLPVIILMMIESRRAGGYWQAVRGLASGREAIFLSIGAFLGTFLGLTLMMYGMANAPLGVSLALTSTYPVWIMIGERIFGTGTISRRGSLLVVGSVAGIWLMVWN